MRSNIFPAALALLAALAAPRSALAQEFGLDLTRDGPNLQPSIAVVTSSLPDAVAVPESVPTSIAELAKRTNLYSRIVSASETRERLSKEGAPRADCRDAACLLDLSHGLEVDRVIVALAGPDSLRLIGYDWGSGALAEAFVDNETVGGPGGAAAIEAAVAPMLRKLSTPLGELVVTTNVETAEVRWGTRLVGKGVSVQGAVPAGTQPVSVSADGHRRFEQDVTVPSAGRAEVEATLEKGEAVVSLDEEFDRPRKKASGGGFLQSGFWKRPGFLTAAGGAVVAGVGAIIGAHASSVNARMVDRNNNGVLDISRADALAGQRSATWANVLGATGIAAIAGGAAWLFFDMRTPPAKPSVAVTPSGTGVAIHGTF